MPRDLHPQIDISGSPGDMGLAHGRLLKDRIHHTAAAMRQRIGSEPYDACWSDFQGALRYCESVAPELADEMEGIAEGAAIDLRDVFLINAHLDLQTWKRVVWEAGPSKGAECSSHAIVTPADVLLGWNGDDWIGWHDCAAVLRGSPDNGIPYIYWSLAGSVGRPGMNSFLSLGANGVPSSKWHWDGLLYPMLCRLVLGCHNTLEAVDVLRNHQACSAMNYLVADVEGNLIDIEVGCDAVVLQKPEDQGVEESLHHTNCYLHKETAGRQVDLDDVCPRLSAARRLYRDHLPTTVAEVRQIQSDHSGGICVHREESGTIVSFVAEIRRGSFHVTSGNPCSNHARTFDLN